MLYSGLVYSTIVPNGLIERKRRIVHAMEHNVALGLGANLGDREQQLKEAIKLLQRKNFIITACSNFYDTAPVDCVPGTPRFLNATVIGKWHESPKELLQVCKDIETEMGRPTDHSSSESRVIDVDILLFDDQILDGPTISIPHPRLTERRFILEPLNEIAPGWPIPGSNQTVADAYQQLS